MCVRSGVKINILDVVSAVCLIIMSSDEDDSLGLLTARSKHNYDVGSVNTAGVFASASSSDSDDESFSSGHVDVSTGHRVHSTDSW